MYLEVETAFEEEEMQSDMQQNKIKQQWRSPLPQGGIARNNKPHEESAGDDDFDSQLAQNERYYDQISQHTP